MNAWLADRFNSIYNFGENLEKYHNEIDKISHLLKLLEPLPMNIIGEIWGYAVLKQNWNVILTEASMQI